MRYAVVDSTTNIVLNVVLWDGVAPWSPPENTYVIQSDTLEIGDTVP